MRKYRKFVFLFIGLCLSGLLFAQQGKSSDYFLYASLLREADSLYMMQNYDGAINRYMETFKIKIPKSELAETPVRYNIAACYSLAGKPDSAFLYLNHIADKAAFKGINQLTSDRDLKLLRSDPRWKILIDKVNVNVENNKLKPAK